MNRRAFLGRMVGGLAATAAVRTFPFRVFSFPSDIRVATVSEYQDFMTVSDLMDRAAINPIVQQCALELGHRAGLSLDFLLRKILKDEYVV